jgi:hypothetical protein
MNQDNWFFLNDGQIQGPLSKDEIEQKSAQFKSLLIWGRGLTEWLPVEKWRVQLENLTKASIMASKDDSQRMWRIAIGDNELKPLSYQELIPFLKKQTQIYEIKLWTEGYSDWREVFQIHKIMDEIGASKRSHPRVPIMGSISVQTSTGQIEAKLQSISEGGLGAVEMPGVSMGERLQIVIKSPNLLQPLQASAEIVFVGQEGYAGLKFTQIQAESQSMIIEYIKKFTGA